MHIIEFLARVHVVMRGISEHVPGWLMVSLMFRNLREVLNCVIVHRVFLFDIPGKQELKLEI